jgi:drug/metabolite transporter (DMT)-like permease
VALVLVQIFFGVHYFVAKIVLTMMPARAWASLRIVGAAALLALYNAIFLRQRPASRADWGRLALFALLGVVINQVLFAEGLSRTTPAHSAIINSTIPVATLGFAILLGREKTTLRRLLSLAIAFGSVLVLLRVESLRLREEWVLGDLLTLANATSFSLFLVLSRDFLRRTHPLAATSWLLGLGALGIVAVGMPQLGQIAWETLPPRFWLLSAYVIVFPTALAYFLNYYALRHVESSMVALFIYLQAPIAGLLSYFYFGERPTGRFFVAAAGIFLGVFLAVANGGRRRRGSR